MVHGHVANLLSRVCCRPGGQRQGLLASFDKHFGMLNRRVLENAMAEIENVALPAQTADRTQGYFSNFLKRAEHEDYFDRDTDFNPFSLDA
jgi:hypothetical protein